MNATQPLTPSKEALNRIYWPAQLLVIGLLQQTITWYMVIYYFRTETLKQRHILLLNVKIT